MRDSVLTSVLIVAAFAVSVPAQAPLSTVRIASGLARPVWVGQAPGETDLTRLFVIEQQQADIHIVLNGVVQNPPFLDLTSAKVQTSGNEQGLLGMTFHPDFQTNGLFYINFTSITGGATIVERYGVVGPPATATSANVGSATVIIGPITQPQNNHNGGNLAFGPDGKLYVGMGDGGNTNDTGAGHVAGGNAQSGTTLLGKMLRLNADGSIPSDNPFVSPTDGIMDQIWHFGMRNPWRWSFDAQTGDLWIADVGQDAHEEIDFQPAGQGGKNFGWRCMEGFTCTGLSGCTCNFPTLVLPLHDYSHAAGNCSVIGGSVYRGQAIPGLSGTYFFADYCSGRIWSLRYDGVVVSQFTDRTAELAPGGGLAIDAVTSFGTDVNGELYICDQTGGEIYKIVSCLLPGVDDDVLALTIFDENQDGTFELYAGGEFTTAGSVAANRVASWNGSVWSALGSGMNLPVQALTSFNNGLGEPLYAGGEFTTAGGVSANRIARWNGASWSALGSGMNNIVSALTVFDEGADGDLELFAGGYFTIAGGTSAKYVARWDGTSWSKLGTGMNSAVLALTAFDDLSGGGTALYAGGYFTTAGGTPAANIAKWDGTSWSALGTGMNGAVLALTAVDLDGSGPKLVAGGAFTLAGGTAVTYVATWDGSSWAALGSGMNNYVLSLTAFDDDQDGFAELYAGGVFTTAGGLRANRIAMWSWPSPNWSPLGSGMDNRVYALAAIDKDASGNLDLIAGGAFTTAGGVAASKIAKWNGTSW